MAPRPLTSLRLRALDALERDPLVPPHRLQLVGQGDFAATGDEFARHLTELTGLQPGDRVLDIGCGIGRMARPLTQTLDPDQGGAYTGFDIEPVGIGWCQARYPSHFRFVLADLYNARYRPQGTEKATEYRFPADDDSQDVVLATSVFTHLLEQEAEHYAAETRRTMAPNARGLVTFFLLDDASRAALAEGTADQRFQDPEERVAVVSDDLPEDAVAYDEQWVRDRLPVKEIHRGSWRGTDGPSYQDLVILQCS